MDSHYNSSLLNFANCLELGGTRAIWGPGYYSNEWYKARCLFFSSNFVLTRIVQWKMDNGYWHTMISQVTVEAVSHLSIIIDSCRERVKIYMDGRIPARSSW